MQLSRKQIIAALVFIALLLATVAMLAWPRHDRLLARLRSLSDEGRYDQAIALGERYLSRESKSGEFFVVLGGIYQQTGRYQDAATAYRRALSLDPGNAAVPSLLAQSLRALSRRADADAIRWLAEAAACDPTDESIFLDLGRYASLDELLLTPTDTAAKIVKAWEAAKRAHPALQRNESVRRVVAQMAVVAGNDSLAESLLPVAGDDLATRRLFQAQRALVGAQRDLAEAFIREAHAAAPLRQDVLAVMAQLGVAARADVETLASESIPDGEFTANRDATQLYYSGLRIYDLAAGRFRTPAGGVTGFALSPSGTRLAYFLSGRDGSELFVALADGSEAKLIARGPTGGDQASWSPDERQLAFTTAAGLEVANSDGSDRRVVVAPSGTSGDDDSMTPAFPAWAPVRDRIAYAISLVEGTGGVAAVTPTGRPAGFASPLELSRPRWAANGRWLLADPDNWALPAGPPVVISESGAVSEIAGMSRLIRDAAWSHEGTWLAYTADDPELPATLMADGAGIAPARRLWVRRWPDGAPQLVDVGPGRYEQVQWLPERRLALTVRSPQGGVKLYVVKLK
ncbi:MAG: tetratricopeptide repeat protein [Chloroflexota bacterium]